MALELGKNDRGYPMQARIRTSAEGIGFAQRVIETNISDVFDGPDHIWPVRPDDFVVELKDVTSFQVRYLWGVNDGRDLDTSSMYLNSPEASLNNVTVGWSQDESIFVPWLYWGGDNTSSGAECVMFNVEQFNKNNGMWSEMPEWLTMVLGARWYGERSEGNFSVEVTAYKGGVIVKAYQLNNVSSNETDGFYIFPDADGNIRIKLGDGEYHDCWFGEAIELTVDGVKKYYKINMKDDSVMGLPEGTSITIERQCPISGYVYKKGWYVPEGTENSEDLSEIPNACKIWNGQYNEIQTGTVQARPGVNPIHDAGSVTVHGDSYGLYCCVLLDEQGNALNQSAITPAIVYNNGPVGYGFVSGNSEFKGRKYLSLNVPKNADEDIDNPYLIAYIYYNTRTLDATVEGLEYTGDLLIRDSVARS